MEMRSSSRRPPPALLRSAAQARVGVCHQEGPKGEAAFFWGEMNLLNHSWMLGRSNPRGRRQKGE